MNRLLHGWNSMRLLRAAFAMIFLFAAISRDEPVAWFAAAFFGLQAVLNIGCCGVESCQAVRKGRTAPVLPDTITYEEIR